MDFNGNPVYYQASKTYITSDNYRLITIYIYPDFTSAGIANITILGIADKDKDGNEIPLKWKNVYNTKWIKNDF